MLEGNGNFTVKEIVLETQKEVRELDAKLDVFIRVHEQRHIAEQESAYIARSDPVASAAGRKLLSDISNVAETGRNTRTLVIHHDVLIQRLIGATTLASFLGVGTLFLLILRIAGFIPSS